MCGGRYYVLSEGKRLNMVKQRVDIIRSVDVGEGGALEDAGKVWESCDAV